MDRELPYDFIKRRQLLKKERNDSFVREVWMGIKMKKNKNGLRSRHSLVFTNKMFLFILPALFLFAVFWIAPLIQLFYYSFTDFNGVNYHYNFVGWKNYRSLFKDGTLWNAVKNTLLYAVMIVLGSNLMGLGMALILNSRLKGKTFFRTIAYLPALFSAIVVGFIWSYIYMPRSGLIASLIELFGGEGNSFNILGNFKTALVGIAIVEIWKAFGNTMIIYLAGLQTVDESLLESAKMDGCNEWQSIARVKLPLIAPTITINIILNIIAGLKAFDYAFIMTNGGPGKSTNTLMFTVYKLAFNEQVMGKASALSVMAFLIIVLITSAMLTLLNKREVEL